jgi:hypothetical protein
MLELKLLDLKIEKKILGLYHIYRQTIIENEPDQSIINRINEIFFLRTIHKPTLNWSNL